MMTEDKDSDSDSDSSLPKSRNGGKIPPPTQSNGPSLGQRILCFGLAFCFIALVTMVNFNDTIDEYFHQKGTIKAKLDDVVTLPMQPKSLKIQGVEHYFLLPPKLENGGGKNKKPKGILIFLHSCKRSGLEFFSLPEDRIVARDALDKRLAVLAVTSQHRESGCWTLQDTDWIDGVVDEWAHHYNLQNVPRMGMAVSSAASFLFFVYQPMKLKSMAIYNSPQGYDRSELPGIAIPTAFITMPLDDTISTHMENNFHMMTQAGVPSQLYKVTSHPFTEKLCQARLPEMGAELCQELFHLLHKEYPHLLDVDSFIKEDLKSGKWQELFQKLGLEHKTEGQELFVTDTSHSGKTWLYAGMEQEIAVCEAFHSMTSEHHSSVLEFLMQSAGIGGPKQQRIRGDP
jgi:hypothetical protein